MFWLLFFLKIHLILQFFNCMTIKWFVSITSEQNWHCDGSHISSMIFCKWLTNFSNFFILSVIFWTEFSCCRNSYVQLQGSVVPWLKSSLWKLYGRHHKLVDCCERSISQMTWIFFLTHSFPLLHVVFLYHQQDFYRIWLGVTRLLYNKKTATGFPGFVTRAARVVPLEWNRK
jgi:hypothetical protein